MKQAIIQEARETMPLIQHLTNQVVMNFSANGLLSFGAAPVMAKAEDEAADMASNANGVLLNIGTLTADELSGMIRAGVAANEKGIPVVLDPVGVAATPFRTTAARSILEQVKPTMIKGNAGELAHLVEIPWETKGVESVGEGNADEIAAKVAKTYQTVAVVTGKTDVICTGDEVLQNQSGHSILGKITGAGCLLGSILTACLTTNEASGQQALTALEFYGLAAEHAARQRDVNGPGTFLPHFIDALSLDPAELERT
ncbi:hydroxyethylthiazole kinase [Lentibacillus kapialis]|uniref:Hydroxyethylthiazole kinase n=1 Tax=Lentibacillus kapialis TaxID=340214 RepID=A0A917PRH4_9BACI|nr:hydroxyethylthiazole kinase [Lentibacillus kapialis]GGJ88901.1 hydroxyethylthiazole kinase [Lentibacillus kapialis]